MDPFGEKLEDLKDTDFTFNEQEKFFFVNEDEKVLTYPSQKGVKSFKFESDRKRQICIENFLAFHSFDIGNNEDKNKFLYLLFNGDYEVYQAMLDPEKYKKKIVWKDDFEEGILKTMAEGLKDVEEPFTKVIIRVNQLDDEQLLYALPFTIRPFELYCEVPLPWVIKNKYEQPMVVNLSCFQKEIFLNKGLKIDFYPTETGLEPIILDQEKKNGIFSEIMNRVENFIEKEKEENEQEEKEGKVTVLKFKNGEKDIISALTGTIKYKFHEIVDLETLKNEVYYDKLKENSVLILTYVPNSEKLLYWAVKN